MIFEQFYLGCLAHASYLVGSDGEAAVIDPQRDVDIYLEAAARHGVRIAHVIETHLHADFVSGHGELASRTGARIYLGHRAGAAFSHVPVRDGDTIAMGQCELEFIETPGHTVESVCVVLRDRAHGPAPRMVFTGDTLFVGDVGRPDLAPDLTPRQLAGMLHDSLHHKLLRLPDEVEIYPAHGAGSLCGKQMSSERSSTIGKERRTNYALLVSGKDEFVDLLTADMPAKPEYFSREVELNRQGAASLESLPQARALEAPEVIALQRDGCIVLDTRPVMEFAVAHVPGSIHIGLGGQYASWAARLLGLDARLILVAEDTDRVRESQMRLARVGIERVEGYLAAGLTGWVRQSFPTEFIPQISVRELSEWLLDAGSDALVLDVREPGEWAPGVLPGATCIPLGQVPARFGEIEGGRTIFVHCKGGYRSSIATSLLRRAGLPNVVNVTGGFDAWKAAQLPYVPRLP